MTNAANVDLPHNGTSGPRQNAADRKSSAGLLPAFEQTSKEEDLLREYVFPDAKLKKTLDDPNKTPLVLIACASVSPPTFAHLRLFEMAGDFVAQFQEQYEVVGGYISPVGDAYKKNGLIEAGHRVTMSQLAVETADHIMVDPWEAYHASYKRTKLVLDHFDEEINVKRGGLAAGTGERRKCHIALLAGADLIETMTKPGVWSDEDLDSILGSDHGAYIIERSGTDLDACLAALQPRWRANIQVVKQLITNDISSTKIRQHLAKSMSVRYLIPPGVIKYIDEHKLYHQSGLRPTSQDGELAKLPTTATTTT